MDDHDPDTERSTPDLTGPHALPKSCHVDYTNSSPKVSLYRQHFYVSVGYFMSDGYFIVTSEPVRPLLRTQKFLRWSEIGTTAFPLAA